MFAFVQSSGDSVPPSMLPHTGSVSSLGTCTRQSVSIAVRVNFTVKSTKEIFSPPVPKKRCEFYEDFSPPSFFFPSSLPRPVPISSA